MRHAVCYVSNADKQLTTSEINELLKFSEENNNQKDIKGILLYSEGNFFQVIEGEKEKIISLWNKIQNDPRHYGIITVIDRDIQKGSYDHYRATVIPEGQKYNPGLPPEYLEPLKGISPDVQGVIKGMLRNFIATRV
ncbi:BLUF domain-containing protein [Salinimicrobium xinjiangense]|uniref:BLUF domain-containing protein n=1 Tax=Salinimicrobium xinjiangense TaxID=438596 RepID=UPI000420A4AF|nr:BLUF domain-containing protein [Salinimicrobium xinjiangense]